ELFPLRLPSPSEETELYCLLVKKRTSSGSTSSERCTLKEVACFFRKPSRFLYHSLTGNAQLRGAVALLRQATSVGAPQGGGSRGATSSPSLLPLPPAIAGAGDVQRGRTRRVGVLQKEVLHGELTICIQLLHDSINLTGVIFTPATSSSSFTPFTPAPSFIFGGKRSGNSQREREG
ncbi:hypothetical protein TYRP_019833, partial [Tyrophagus putrescentiae]